SPNDDGAITVAIYQFEAFLAPVPPGAPNQQIRAGQAVFESIGCNLCHVETMQTAPDATVSTDMNGNTLGPVAALDNQTVALYSDLLLHEMGPGLAGGIPQGQANLTQWRTAPLWGLNMRRAFGFLHDLRTTNVDTAIRDHGGEASQSITLYEGLSPQDQNKLLEFIFSL